MRKGLDEPFIHFAIARCCGKQFCGQIGKFSQPHFRSAHSRSKRIEGSHFWFRRLNGNDSFTLNRNLVKLGSVTMEFTTLYRMCIQQTSIITAVSLTTFASRERARHSCQTISGFVFHCSLGETLPSWTGYALGFATHIKFQIYLPT